MKTLTSRKRKNRADAAVACQLLNYVIRAVSAELKVKEVTELEERLEELERVMEHRKDNNQWGA